MEHSDSRLALIVPCYNEETRLTPEPFLAFIAQHAHIDLLFVNDGSRDNTEGVIEALRMSNPQRIFTLHLPQNQGKAEAVRQGMLKMGENSGYSFTGFLDADLSAPLEEVLLLQREIETHRALVAAGCRIKIMGKIIERSLKRHYMSRIFATFYSNLLRLPNYDTQCGLKLFDRQFATEVFSQPFVSRWLFDLELFLRAKIILGKETYAQRIVEVPLSKWCEIGGSKLKSKDIIKAPLEVFRIHRRYKSYQPGI